MEPVDCERCAELLSARLDGELSGQETQELEAHLGQCPECRALAGQLDQVELGFKGLEELEAPEGFARDVIYAINRQPKILPLFRRLQKQAMAVAAAGIVLLVALYGPHTQQSASSGSAFRSAVPNAAGGQEALMEKNARDLPRISAYGMPAPDEGEAEGAPAPAQAGAAPNSMEADQPEDKLDFVELGENTVAMERLPDGAAELIPPETAVSPTEDGRGSVYHGLPQELLERMDHLDGEQGISVKRALTGDGGASDGLFTLIILED